jgi:hypothetical protein
VRRLVGFTQFRASWLALELSWLTLVVCVLFPAWTGAEDDPLRMGLLEVSKKENTRAYRTFRGVVESAKNVDIVSSSELLGEADAVGLTAAILRSSRKRVERREQIQEWMEGLGLEALILVDVFSRGRKFQAVVFGPDGQPIVDVRRKIKRWKLPKSKAKALLRDVFRQLVPAVRESRAARLAAEADSESDNSDNSNEDSMVFDEADLDEEEASDETDDASLNYLVDVGLLAGSRSLLTSSQDGLQIAHDTPLLGAAISGEVVLPRLLGDATTLTVNVGLDVAPFATIFEGTFQYASLFLRYGAGVRGDYALTDTLSAGLCLGVSVLQLTIDANPVYTGSRYMHGRIGGRLGYAANDLSVAAHVVGLPVFETVDSNGVYGAPGFYFGVELGGEVRYQITSMFFFRAVYSLNHFGPSYAERSDPVTSSDTLHLLTIGGGVAL